MQKHVVPVSVAAGLAVTVLFMAVAHFVTADWPTQPDLLKIVAFAAGFGGVAGRCLFIVLSPRAGKNEPASL